MFQLSTSAIIKYIPDTPKEVLVLWIIPILFQKWNNKVKNTFQYLFNIQD
jgi:hypothetical protein